TRHGAVSPNAVVNNCSCTWTILPGRSLTVTTLWTRTGYREAPERRYPLKPARSPAHPRIGPLRNSRDHPSQPRRGPRRRLHPPPRTVQPTPRTTQTAHRGLDQPTRRAHPTTEQLTNSVSKKP